MQYYLKALQNYAVFTGRATRADYWYFVLFNFIFSIVIGLIAGMIRIPILANLYSLAVLLPGIAVGVRRMHDVDKSGWFLLVPIYNLILACTEGDPYENQYGPDPYGRDVGPAPSATGPLGL